MQQRQAEKEDLLCIWGGLPLLFFIAFVIDFLQRVEPEILLQYKESKYFSSDKSLPCDGLICTLNSFFLTSNSLGILLAKNSWALLVEPMGQHLRKKCHYVVFKKKKMSLCSLVVEYLIELCETLGLIPQPCPT